MAIKISELTLFTAALLDSYTMPLAKGAAVGDNVNINIGSIKTLMTTVITADTTKATKTFVDQVNADLNAKVDPLIALMSDTPDANTLVDRYTEVLTILQNFPEGTNLLNALAGKLGTDKLYNGVDSVVTGLAADSRVAKTLYDNHLLLSESYRLQQVELDNKANNLSAKGYLKSEIGMIMVLGAGTLSSFAYSLTSIRLTPIEVVTPFAINKITIRVATGAVGASYKVFFTNSKANGQPGDSIYESPAIPAEATGSPFVALTTNLVLPVGCWVGIAPSGTAEATLGTLSTMGQHPKVHLISESQLPLTSSFSSYIKTYTVGGVLTGAFGTPTGGSAHSNLVFVTLA